MPYAPPPKEDSGSQGHAYCEHCNWTGPDREHWADSFGDLAKHNRKSGHGPMSMYGKKLFHDRRND